MKTFGKYFLRTIISITIVMASVYFTLAYHYRDRFLFGTFANGQYITGLTLDEASKLLSETAKVNSLQVISKDKQIYELNLHKFNINLDYSKSLQKLLRNQNSFSFLGNFTSKPKDSIIVPDVSMNDELLLKEVSSWEIFQKKSQKGIKIVYLVDEGYKLLDTTKDVPDKEQIFNVIKKAIITGKKRVELTKNNGCYKNLPVSAKMKTVMNTYKKIEKAQSTGIIYKFGDDEQELDSILAGAIVTQDVVDIVSKEKSKSRKGEGLFIVNNKEVNFPKKIHIENGFAVDDNSNIIISESLLYEQIDGLCGHYTTIDKNRNFRTAFGKIIQTDIGSYGNIIDTDVEFKFIIDSILKEKKGVHEPKSVIHTFADGNDDIGQTYVEIDIKGQHLYYYANAQLVMDCEIVTGNEKLKRNTPTGVYYVYSKSRNRYLRGPGYISYVKYWMAVYKGVGMHDASWRQDFGNKIYKTSGSHGCINMSTQNAKTLYGIVKIGTPVVIY